MESKKKKLLRQNGKTEQYPLSAALAEVSSLRKRLQEQDSEIKKLRDLNERLQEKVIGKMDELGSIGTP